MNAFANIKTGTVNLSDVTRANKISATRTRQRQEGMKSTDAAVAKQARGTLPGAPLSKRGGRKG